VTTLRIDLREGFAGDAVEIAVDGRVVYSRRDVQTDYSVGLADFIELERAGDAASIEVRVPARGLAERMAIPLAQAPVQYVTVRLGERIEIKWLESPPEYF
jgi:hypothetical protein